MLHPEKLFGNLFDGFNLTPARLVLFAEDALSRVAAEDKTHVLTQEAAAVNNAKLAVATELGDVDQHLNQQVGNTNAVDAVISAFKINMRENDGVIAKKLGGKSSTGYLAFYPHGMSEYSAMTKTQAPILLERINEAAAKHVGLLEPSLVNELQAHYAAWTAARTGQIDKKGVVAGNRGERDAAVNALTLALTTLVRAVAYHWACDVATCSRFFAFHLLDAPRNKSLEHQAETPTT